MGALAEFERNLIRERTMVLVLLLPVLVVNLEGDMRNLLSIKKKVVYDLYQRKEMTIEKICETMGISRGTLYTYVRHVEESLNAE